MSESIINKIKMDLGFNTESKGNQYEPVMATARTADASGHSGPAMAAYYQSCRQLPSKEISKSFISVGECVVMRKKIDVWKSLAPDMSEIP